MSVENSTSWTSREGWLMRQSNYGHGTQFQATLFTPPALEAAILNQSRSLAPWNEPVTVDRYRGRRSDDHTTRIVCVARSGPYILVYVVGCYGRGASALDLDVYEARGVMEVRERLAALICRARWEPRMWDTVTSYAVDGATLEPALDLRDMAAVLLWVESARADLRSHGAECLERELAEWDRWIVVGHDGGERRIATTRAAAAPKVDGKQKNSERVK